MVEPKDKSQSEIFLNSEGDAWFLRNQGLIQSKDGQLIETDFIIRTLKPFRKSISSILEIGCGSGEKLTKLTEYFDASGHGIDPSQLAIDKARHIVQNMSSPLDFEVGLATVLPFQDDTFDLVFFGFCLYLVPPSETYRAIMEANRVLKNGGFMAILDFDYGGLKVNPYKHNPDVLTYKNNYSKLFSSSGYYSLVSKWSFNHEDDFFTQDRDERISIEILYKELLLNFNKIHSSEL